MDNNNIFYAYCEDLGRIVTINEARREYLSSNNTKKYTFYCSTEECREKGVKVTGVNYWVCPKDTPTYKKPHFRRNDQQKESHVINCEWYTDSKEPAPNTKVLTRHNKKSIPKKDFYIKRFLIDVPVHHNENKNTITILTNSLTNSDNSERHSASSSYSYNYKPQTHHLEDLVESWKQARTELSEEEQKQYFVELPFINKKIPIIFLFQRFENAFLKRERQFCVMYGNAYAKRYGLGFSFTFFEKINNKNVSLYITTEQVKAYRYHKYIESNIKNSSKGYYNVYFIPNDICETDKGFNIIVNNLDHLHFRLSGYKK